MSADSGKPRFFRQSFPRILLITGLILLVLTGGVLTFFQLYERSGYASVRQQDSFNRLLGEYDSALHELFFTEREFEFLNRRLDNLERRAISVESWLSILKRRRALADIHRPSAENYGKTIESALNAYPLSQPVIAIACAFFAENYKITGGIEERLRGWLPFFIDPEFNKLRLSLHVLLGDFQSPQDASVLPVNIFNLTPADFKSPMTGDFLSGGAESILVNLAILKTINGDYRQAAADIQTILSENDFVTDTAIGLSDHTLRFAAEYHYDFGDLLRSAEIFSLLNDERSLIRQADALYLAGFHEMASVIWSMLCEPQNGFTHANETSLYNLAATADDQRTAFPYLEKLVNSVTVEENLRSPAWQFGLVRYSRFLDYPEAAALLTGNTIDYPYIHLEILKRLSQEQNPGRQSAQTWFLLDSHDGNKDLYNWAAWLFFFQRNLKEADILIDRFNRIQFTETWADIYRAIRLMNEGNLNAAEKILLSIPSQDADWVVHANIGRILDAVLSPAKALEQYDLAAEKINASANRRAASRIQIRIARCLITLNRFTDARIALQYALTLDPENLNVRLEMDRIF